MLSKRNARREFEKRGGRKKNLAENRASGVHHK
jgi:hypothetical protein